MTDNKSPSQEEPKRGVFSSIQGAHSKDPDLGQEPVEEPEKTEPSEPEKKQPVETVDLGDGSKKGDPRLGKALQRAAQLERQINELGPWAQFGMAVGGDKKQGKQLIERYQAGKPLFLEEGDEEAIERMHEEHRASGEPPPSIQEIRQELDQRDAARSIADDIRTMAEEELPEFKKIRRNPRYAEFLQFYRQSVWGGRTPLHETVADWENDYAAKEMTAVREAYKAYLADNPKVLEAAKKAGEKQAKERAAEAASVPSSEATTTSSGEEPAEKSDAQKAIDRMMNPRGMRKSFASIGSKRR